MTLVYCGQAAGWIDIPLGTEVGLDPGHIVFIKCVRWGPRPPPQKGHNPQFFAHVCCGQMAAWIKMPLGTAVGLGPGNIVLNGDPAPPTERGTTLPLLFVPCLLWPNDRLCQLLLSSYTRKVQ